MRGLQLIQSIQQSSHTYLTFTLYSTGVTREKIVSRSRAQIRDTSRTQEEKIGMVLMDLDRTREEIGEKKLDGLIASSQANFYYTTGFQPPLPGRPGFTIIPASPKEEPAMLVATFNKRVGDYFSPQMDIRSYPIWIEIVEVEHILQNKVKADEKPAQFDLREIYTRLAAILREKGLQKGTVGIEKQSYTSQGYSLLRESAPEVNFVDAEPLFWDLRSVKTAEEIKILTTAARITELGVKAMTDDQVEGATIGELYHRYKTGVMSGLNKETAMSFELSRAMISAGDHFLSVRKEDYRIPRGQTIYCDAGITFQGYVSDMGRTFVVGKPNDLQKKIFGAIKAGYDAALKRLGPGVRMKEIFEAAVEATRKAGLEWYTRGHMGHALGVAPGAEQPPFISATEERVFQPNMVICLEAPLYVAGLGGFQVEDEIVITQNGYEFLTTLPREMREV